MDRLGDAKDQVGAFLFDVHRDRIEDDLGEGSGGESSDKADACLHTSSKSIESLRRTDLPPVLFSVFGI